MPMIQLGDFAPDSDQLIPGNLSDMDGFYSTSRGFKAQPGLVALTSKVPDLLDATVQGGIVAELVSGQRVTIVGTRNGLWKEVMVGDMNTGTWENALDPGLSPGMRPSDLRWNFSVFGNLIVATNGVECLYSDSGTPFVRVPNSPPPSLISVGTDYGFFFVAVASNFIESGVGGPLSLWNDPSIQNEVDARTLTSTPGPILAAHALLGGVVFYKERSVLPGTFVGPPFFWAVDTASREAGAAGQGCIVNLGDRHLFVGPNNFYEFDGASVRPIPNRLHLWFFDRLDVRYAKNIVSRYERSTNMAYWYYPSTKASPEGSLDEWVGYNIRTGRWCRGTLAVDNVLSQEFVKTGMISYATLASRYSRYDGLPASSYDAITRVAQTNIIPAVVLPDHKLYGYMGPSAGGFLTAIFGDVEQATQVTRMLPQFGLWPTSHNSKLIASTQQRTGRLMPDTQLPSIATQRSPALLSAVGAYDFVQAARIHQLRMEFDSDVEVIAMDINSRAAGVL